MGVAVIAAAVGGASVAAPGARAQGWDWQGHPGPHPWAGENERWRQGAEWYRPGGRWYRFGGLGYPAWGYQPGAVVAWSAPSYRYQYQYQPGYSETYSYIETAPHRVGSTTIYRQRTVAQAVNRPAMPHPAVVAKAPAPTASAAKSVHTATVVNRARTVVVERRIHTVTVVHPGTTVAVPVPTTQQFVERTPPQWVGAPVRGFGGERPPWRPGPRWHWGD